MDDEEILDAILQKLPADQRGWLARKMRLLDEKDDLIQSILEPLETLNTLVIEHIDNGDD